MLETATRYSGDDRIDMKECLDLINEQLKIIDGIDREQINNWKYNDAIVEHQEKYIPDIINYKNPSDIIRIITKLKGLVFLRFTETGRVYDLLALRNASLLSGNVFEFEVRDEIHKRTKRIRAAVNDFEIKKDHNCEMRTGHIYEQPNDFPLINNFKKAIESSEECVYINGNYVIEIVVNK